MSDSLYKDVRNDPAPDHLLSGREQLEPYHFKIDNVRLFLWRLRNDKAMPVLLLHGASAGAQTFTIPGSSNGEPRSLMDWLHSRGFEPWLLDWRGSMNVAQDLGQKGLLANIDELDFDHAAERDIPTALRLIKEETNAERLGAVGFCMGAGTLAQAIASGKIEKKLGLSHVVLLTLGLFYRAPAESLLKVQDHLLERLLKSDGGREVGRVFAIDPRIDSGCYKGDPGWDWPAALEKLYRNWPGRLKPLHTASEIEEAADVRKSILRMCNRVCFMFGDPYREMNLVPELHQHELPRQFGAIPIRMYAQGAKNVRRGWAARFGANDIVTGETGVARTGSMKSDPREFLSEKSCRQFFDTLDRITLISGAMNRLWHRDSIDRMYEWLVRGNIWSASSDPQTTIEKAILAQYGHQDLLWGVRARRDVFPHILRGLGNG